MAEPAFDSVGWWLRSSARTAMRRHLLAGSLLLVLATLALYPFCDLAFRCGCHPAWGAGADHCNVHASEGAHCPWCEHAALGTVGFLLTVFLQAIVYLWAWRRARSAAAAGAAAALAFPLAASLAALGCWLPTDYPHFFVRGARARLGLPDGPIRCTAPARPPARAEGEAGPGTPGTPPGESPDAPAARGSR